MAEDSHFIVQNFQTPCLFLFFSILLEVLDNGALFIGRQELRNMLR